jgi:hypothetical protein
MIEEMAVIGRSIRLSRVKMFRRAHLNRIESPDRRGRTLDDEDDLASRKILRGDKAKLSPQEEALPDHDVGASSLRTVGAIRHIRKPFQSHVVLWAATLSHKRM